MRNYSSRSVEETENVLLMLLESCGGSRLSLTTLLVVSTHLKNMLLKLGHLPQVCRGENKESLKPPPRRPFQALGCPVGDLVSMDSN